MPDFRPSAGSVPTQLARALGQHLEAAPLPADALRARVRAYRDHVRHMGGRSPFVNVAVSDRLAERLEHLLARLDDPLPAYERGLIQGAALYYVDPNEQDPDLVNQYGFDDDAEIVDAVAAWIDATCPAPISRPSS